MLPTRLVALLKRVSRSFYLSVRVLPAPVQSQVALGYLVARAADTIADTTLIPPAERGELLGLLSDAVAMHQGVTADLRLRLGGLLTDASRRASSETALAELALLAELEECLDLLRQTEVSDRKLIQQVIAQLTFGMREDLRRFPSASATVSPSEVVGLQTSSELDTYTYYAAGCVGEFWTDLMAAHLPGLGSHKAPELRERGIDLGKALQLVNVIRDVAADLKNGRCYWPAELIDPHGLTAQRLAELAAATGPPLSATEATALRTLATELEQLTLQRCLSAWPYVQAIPARQVRLRLACVWPLLLAVQTLTALRQVGSPLLCPGSVVKITRQQVYRLVARSSAAAIVDASYSSSKRLDAVFEQAVSELRSRSPRP